MKWSKMPEAENRPVIIIADRPYHLDRFINHGVYEMISQMGVDVITADSAPPASSELDDLPVLTQWEYTNRIYNTGKYVNECANLELIQLNSFGCGLDSHCQRMSSLILSRASGKNVTFIRIDEITSPGSIRLRLRTLIEFA